jgi:hypothetical protein
MAEVRVVKVGAAVRAFREPERQVKSPESGRDVTLSAHVGADVRLFAELSDGRVIEAPFIAGQIMSSDLNRLHLERQDTDAGDVGPLPARPSQSELKEEVDSMLAGLSPESKWGHLVGALEDVGVEMTPTGLDQFPFTLTLSQRRPDQG